MSTHAPLPLCTFPACSRPVRALGLCVGHHKQQENGKPLTALRSHAAMATGCLVPDCALPHWGNGLCRPHNRQRVKGKLVPADAAFKVQYKYRGRWFMVGYGNDRNTAHHVFNAFRSHNPGTPFRLIVGRRPES